MHTYRCMGRKWAFPSPSLFFFFTPLPSSIVNLFPLHILPKAFVHHIFIFFSRLWKKPFILVPKVLRPSSRTDTTSHPHMRGRPNYGCCQMANSWGRRHSECLQHLRGKGLNLASGDCAYWMPSTIIGTFSNPQALSSWNRTLSGRFGDYLHRWEAVAVVSWCFFFQASQPVISDENSKETTCPRNLSERILVIQSRPHPSTQNIYPSILFFLENLIFKFYPQNLSERILIIHRRSTWSAPVCTSWRSPSPSSCTPSSSRSPRSTSEPSPQPERYFAASAFFFSGQASF